jgi:hypothetical protein
MTSSSRSKKQEVFDNVKNSLVMEISGAVRWGNEVTSDESSVTVDGKTYRLSGGRIWRNDAVLTPESVVVRKMKIDNYSGVSEFVSLVIYIELEDKYSSLVKDNLRIVVSQRKTSVEEGS